MSTWQQGATCFLQRFRLFVLVQNGELVVLQAGSAGLDLCVVSALLSGSHSAVWVCASERQT